MTTSEKNTVQFIRVIDMFVIAPILINISTKKELSKDTQDILFLIGLLTFTYNGYHFLKNA